MAPAWSVRVALVASLLAGCGDSSLEVRGVLNRVIGETVQLDLVQGDPSFSGDVTLKTADNAQLKAAALNVTKTNDRSLTFVVPTDIAVGKATAAVGKQGGGTYDVALQINRLVVALDDKGVIELLPLSPTTLKKSTITIGGTKPLMALSPTGGELATYTSTGEIRLRALGQETKDVAPGLTQQGGQCLGAVPGGALVGTDTDLYLFRFVKGKTSSKQVKLAGCKAIAVNADGTVAAVLSSCDTNSDSTLEDCLTVVRIGTELTTDPSIKIDDTPSATTLAMTRDGKGVVIGDKDSIYGVYLDPDPKGRISTISWGFSSTPVAIDRAQANVQGMTIDLFAVGEREVGKVLFVGFNAKQNNDLQKTSEATVSSTTSKPTGLAFGRNGDLYVALGSKLAYLDATLPNPTPSDAKISADSAIVSFTVQP
jgi:hypothetical protein